MVDLNNPKDDPASNQESPGHDPLDAILGDSPAIRHIKSLIEQAAVSDITILITGESGTGKELVARAIHELSSRRKGPLVTLNCGAIPEGIFESEIFGHERGSFTSADRRRQGYFETADRGTIFLDEIGEMPLKVQVKMLRVLESGRFARVGGTRELQVDVRIIAATNKELEGEVIRGRFRQDLYYRLKTINITLPPLRERPEDIPPLAVHFTADFARRNQRPEPLFDGEGLELLKRYHWSGNVRELRNFVESLVALSQERVITVDQIRRQLGPELGGGNLPMVVPQRIEELDRELIFRTLLEMRHDITGIKNILQRLVQQRDREWRSPFGAAEEIDAYSLEDLEREQIRRALAEFNGNRRQAARALGIGERTLYRKIKQFDLK